MAAEKHSGGSRRSELEESMRGVAGLILNTTRETFAYQDCELRYKWVNRALCRALKSSSGSVKGRRCFEVWYQQSSPCKDCPVNRALLNGRFEEGEVTLPDGRIWLLRGYPVFEDQAKVRGVVQFGQDVTERKRLEEEQVTSKKLESVGILAGGIAHDFNNFLAVIMGNIELALWAASSTPEVEHPLGHALEACQGAQRLTRKFLTFAQGGEPVPDRIPIEPVVRDAASLALAGSNVSSELLLPEGLWQANADAGQIKEALHQVFLNAREAMPQGGKLTVSAKNVSQVSDTTGRSLALPDGEYVKLSIRDRGSGISQRDLPRIFDPYFTTKERSSCKGTGLGLTLVHSIVRKHGGHIEASSRPKDGTTVTVYLPASPVQPSDGQAGTDRLEPPAGGKVHRGRILVMDDEDLVLDVVRRMLLLIGYEADCVSSGEEAVEAYRRQQTAGAPYDAVILDLTVKGGLGGLDTLKQLQGIDPSVKALVSSGYSNDPNLVDFSAQGFQGAIPKPFRAEELKDALEAVLGS